MSLKKIQRVGIIGLGAMGSYVIGALQRNYPDLAFASLLNEPANAVQLESFPALDFVYSVQDLIAWSPDIVVECAGHDAVIDHVPALLKAGIDTVIASIGTLADPEIFAALNHAANLGNTKLALVSGAIGGLDALRSAKASGLKQVQYTGRKPPHAWKGSPAETEFNLDEITEPTLIFQGTATEAAIKYPKNANVCAAVALSGVGFDQTHVQLFADPSVHQNIHEVQVDGNFGEFHIRLSNNPLPQNPRTSWLAALSIEEAVTKQLNHLTF